MRSRPRRTPWTRPAPARTSRCFVIAWRVTADPAVSRTIDCGPPAHSRATSASRVSSPSAAKTGPARARPAVLALCGDMPLDVLELLGPALVVHAEGLGAARGRYLVEARLGHGELRAAGDLLETELHESRRLARIVHAGLDRVRMPAVGEQALGIDPFDRYFHHQVLVARRSDFASNAGARRERALELHAKPGAKLLRVRDRAPDPRPLRAQNNLSFDAVRAHMQPSDWILAPRPVKCNPEVAL